MSRSMVEMRVGMSTYWVTLTQDSDKQGWTAIWQQNGRGQQVSSRGTKRDALDEARNVARGIESRENVTTVPCPPTLRTGETRAPQPSVCMCGAVNPTASTWDDGLERNDCCGCH